jgi:small subunit ribosomal protein S20
LANIKSAIKRIRQNEKRRVRNRVVRTQARTYVKKADALMTGDDQAATLEAVHTAISALDKAAQKGVIHRANAARRKSRLMKRLGTLQKQA